MLKLMLLTVGIVVVSLLFLSVNILLRGGVFRSEHIGQSRELRKRGIHCVRNMDIAERAKDPHQTVRTERGVR